MSTDIVSALQLYRYVEQNYSQQEWNVTTFLLQEAMRIAEARDFEKHGDRAYTGWPALEAIKNMLSTVQTLDPAFAGEIKRQLVAAEGRDNVRGQVKSVWVYPVKGYLPWKECDDSSLAARLIGALGPLTGTLSLNKGRVFVELGNVVEQVWDCCPELAHCVAPFALERNLEESSHVTVVNSNIVADCGEEKVKRFLNDYQASHGSALEVRVFALHHTISLDWARFSICVVVKVQSTALELFIDAFNKHFDADVRKTGSHVTVAVLNRGV